MICKNQLLASCIISREAFKQKLFTNQS